VTGAVMQELLLASVPEAQIVLGDRVKLKTHGSEGKVVSQSADGNLIVQLDDGQEVNWSLHTAEKIFKAKAESGDRVLSLVGIQDLPFSPPLQIGDKGVILQGVRNDMFKIHFDDGFAGNPPTIVSRIAWLRRDEFQVLQAAVDSPVARDLHEFLAAVLEDRDAKFRLQVERKLKKAGISSLRALIPLLFTKSSRRSLNSRLKSAGEKCFTSDTLCALRGGVLNLTAALKGFLKWAAPMWKNEDLVSVIYKLDRINIHSVIQLHKAFEQRWDVSINEKLARRDLKRFTAKSLQALRQRTEQIIAFESFQLSAHLISGQKLADVPAHTEMTGWKLFEALEPYLDRGTRLQSAVYEGSMIHGNQSLRDLRVKPDAIIQVVLEEDSEAEAGLSWYEEWGGEESDG